MLLNLGRSSSYEKLKQEIENIARAQQTSLGTTMPMDLGALDMTKGTKGKGKGGRAASVGVVCHICKKAGHYAKDCWQKGKGAKANGKGKEKGSGGGKRERRLQVGKARASDGLAAISGISAKPARVVSGHLVLPRAVGSSQRSRLPILTYPMQLPLHSL